MRNLWHRLLIKLGLRRKPMVLKGRCEISILGPDGKRVVIGVFKSVSYLPADFGLGKGSLPSLDKRPLPEEKP